MLDTFNPLPHGKWDPKVPMHKLKAYAVVGVMTDELQAVLALKSKDGTRHDFQINLDDLEDVADCLQAFVEKLRSDGAAMRKSIEAAELNRIVPFGPN